MKMDPYSLICLFLIHIYVAGRNYETFHYTNTNVADFSNPLLFPLFLATLQE